MSGKNTQNNHNKIILLEDEKVLGNFYRKKLEEANFEVRLLTTTKEVEKTIKEFKADLVLLDHSIHNEDKTGLDIITNVKEALPESKIVMLSNYSQAQLKEESPKVAVDGYLLKIETPPDELVDYVSRLLNS